MNKEEYRRISTLFIRARGVDGARRAELLEQARKDEPEIVARVVALLAAESAEPDFMKEPYLGENFSITGMEDALDKEPVLPEKIERYTIDGLIGMGGMGIVYRGRQPSPRREVAVKVMRPGVVSADKLQRFLFEVEMLGKLDHPGIAKIFEAGSHDSELGPVPFFAMELVEGRTLMDYARESELSRADEVELMILLCEAVQHAHERGIVHRDLKPANIVVTEAGRPKILDFGVARPTDYDVHAGARLTQTGQLIGTLAYMSPEQLIGDGSHVDTRSDVYSLGAVAYELLTGQPPFDLEGKSLPEAARFLAERTPLPAGSVRATLKGDLETILHKALEKDPDRRYASANELATDLRHYLSSEAILARPPSTLYRLRMFARRRKALVASGLAALLALGIGFGASLWALVEVRTAHAAVDRMEMKTANTPMDGFFGEIPPELKDLYDDVREKKTANTPDAEILELMRDEVPRRFHDQPEALVAAYWWLGKAFKGCGQPKQAQIDLEKALILCAEFPADHDVVLSTKIELGSNLVWLDRPAEGEALLREALDDARASPDRKGKAVFAVYALATLVNRLNSTAPEQAEQLARQAIAESEALRDTEHFTRARIDTTALLGATLVTLGRADEARAAYKEALELRGQNLSPKDDVETRYVIQSYANLLMNERDFTTARKHLTDLVDFYAGSYGPKSADTLSAQNLLAVATQDDKELQEALTLFREVEQGRQETLGPDHPDTLITRNNIAQCLIKVGNREEAEEILVDVIERGDQHLEPEHRYRIYPRVTLAKLYIDTERYAEAEPLLQESLKLLEAHFDQTHWRVKNVKRGLVKLYDAWGKPDLADRYR